MEESLDVQLDFENISRPQIVETFSNEVTKETSPYIETELKGSKVYVCTFPTCNKAFRYVSQANRHNIVHKKDRPYTCTFKGCNKSFKRTDILETHMQLHTDNLSYICDEPGCNQKFTSKPALKRHEAKHVNNGVVKCHVEGCGKSFLQISQLKQHIKVMHADNSIVSAKEEEDPIDPEMEKEFQQLLDAPYTRTEWKIMAASKEKNEQTKKGQELCRHFINYIIKQMRILKEEARNANEAQKPIQVNDDNITLGSIIQNSFSDFVKFSEQMDSDALKFLEWIKHSTDSAL